MLNWHQHKLWQTLGLSPGGNHCRLTPLPAPLLAAQPHISWNRALAGRAAGEGPAAPTSLAWLAELTPNTHSFVPQKAMFSIFVCLPQTNGENTESFRILTSPGPQVLGESSQRENSHFYWSPPLMLLWVRSHRADVSYF